MLVVNASNIEKDWNWINSQNTFGAELENASERMSIIALQGPEATNILQPFVVPDLRKLVPFTFITTAVESLPDVIVSATGYTGAGGFEIICHNSDTEKIWNLLMQQGKAYGLKPAGLAVRDLLRLEMGYSLYGNDLNDSTSAIEAGLGWIVKFVDGKDFIDRPLLEKQKTEGVTRKLIGFEMIDKGIPRKEYKLLNSSGKEIGVVTSGTMSPILQKGIGMAYLDFKETATGNEIFVEIRNKPLRAQVVRFPFIK